MRVDLGQLGSEDAAAAAAAAGVALVEVVTRERRSLVPLAALGDALAAAVAGVDLASAVDLGAAGVAAERGGLAVPRRRRLVAVLARRG